ncbi:MAG: hypothetical protein IJ568_04000, partial [Bacilli bacterium]|nr:hypothetical protein [Bacilli bacterium]
MTNTLNDFDIVSYNNDNYIIRLVYNIDGTISYNLYSLDGKLYKTNVHGNYLTFVDSYDNFFAKLNSKTTPSGGSNYSSSGKSYSGGTTRNNTTMDEKESKDLSDAIGTVDKTEETLLQCESIILEAKDAVSGANLTLETWDDVNNAQGFATDASITFLSNMVESLNTIEKNLESNKQAAKALHKLNISLKQLLIKFVEKKEKEKERDDKKAQYEAEPEYKEETDSNGNVISVHNDRKDKLKQELDKI